MKKFSFDPKHPPAYAIVRAKDEYHVVHSVHGPMFSHHRKTEATKFVDQHKAHEAAKIAEAEMKAEMVEKKKADAEKARVQKNRASAKGSVKSK